MKNEKLNPLLDNVDYQNGEYKILDESKPKHIICYSGGLSSALVACMVVQRYGNGNVILVNHPVADEPEDVARFEEEIASYLRLAITYVKGDLEKYPDLSVQNVTDHHKAFAFKVGANNNVLCTSKLKTEPFYAWLKENYQENDILYYGFDASEQSRIDNRVGYLAKDNYLMDAPLATWENPLTPDFLDKIQVKRPAQYEIFKHANCIGCHKAGRLHWLCVYINKREVFNQRRDAEEKIDHCIIKGIFLYELEELFYDISRLPLEINERQDGRTLFAKARKMLAEKKIGQKSLFNHFWDHKDTETKPCECV